MPLVSVLMTSYNREKYIAQAIESVLCSTFKDFELIIVDDLSKDRTVEIAKGYESIDPRVKVYINEQNLGDYPNRNKAASYAIGKYLKYVDADDLIYPWGLELMVKMMESFPQAGFGICSLIQDKTKIFPFCLKPEEAYKYHYLGPGLFHKAPLSAIIKRDVFEATGGFMPYRMVGDYEMWHRLAQSYSVVLMPQGLVWYRTHDSQEINSYKKYRSKYIEIKLQYLQSLNIPLSSIDKRLAIIQEIKISKRELIRSMLRFDFDNLNRSLKQIVSLRKILR